jgi:hypothetical protein
MPFFHFYIDSETNQIQIYGIAFVKPIFQLINKKITIQDESFDTPNFKKITKKIQNKNNTKFQTLLIGT